MDDRFDLNSLLYDDDEQPLEHFPAGGGYCRVFRSLGIVGDSLAAGEFETRQENGTPCYTDMYEYAWGAYLGRMAGIEIHNFSRGGMTAKEYLDTWAEENHFWDPALACQGYILALGDNDLFFHNVPTGTVEDAKCENPNTFAGQMMQIVRRYREIQPEAKFFFVTMPKWQPVDEWEVKAEAHAVLLREMSSVIPNSYVIDLRRYVPSFDAKFRERMFMFGHMNPLGYVYTADVMAAYIDYLVRHHAAEFNMLGFMPHGTPTKLG